MGADVGGMLKVVGNLTKDALTFKWAQATMKDVAVNTVVVVEIACWFFIGECIGKGSLVGSSLSSGLLAVFCSSETDSFSSVVVDIFLPSSETWLSVKSKIYLISEK